MSINLHLQFLDNIGGVVGTVELVQTPTDVTWWCVGYTDRDGKKVENFVEPTTEEIKSRYFKWLDELDWTEDWLKEKVEQAFEKYANYTAEFYWM